MSTKSTIAHGNDFHFYEDYIDEEAVFLQLKNPHGDMTVRIPHHIWETIRHHKVQTGWVDSSDDDIIEYVRKEVKERIDEYNSASGSSKELYNIFGFGIYGLASDSEEVQIEKGFKYFSAERAKQQEMKEKMKSNKIIER